MRYNEIKPLMEINMSPSNLKQTSSSINATVGIEFEMCFPALTHEIEQDVDNERIKGNTKEEIYNQILNFFSQNDSNSEQIINAQWDILLDEFYEYIEYINKDNPEFDKNNIEPDEFIHYLHRDHMNSMKSFVGDSDLEWPTKIVEISEQQDIQDIAEDFTQEMKTKIVISPSAERNKYWIIESDGSLRPNHGDNGWEIVSPPLPLMEMLKSMQKLTKWAKSRGCYTNSSTGLHINVSLPDWNSENLDYVKLALLLGDNYLLQQFDRIGNTYARSITDIFNTKMKNNNSDLSKVEQIKERMQNGMMKQFYSTNTTKHVTINRRDNRVEFRAMGGDWLGIMKSNPDKIINNIFRMVVVLDAAMNPEKFKEEYYKKFYKLFSKYLPNNESLDLFVKYSMGLINIKTLKHKLTMSQMGRGKTPKFFNNTDKKLMAITIKIQCGDRNKIKTHTIYDISPQRFITDTKLDFEDYYDDPCHIELLDVQQLVDDRWKAVYLKSGEVYQMTNAPEDVRSWESSFGYEANIAIIPPKGIDNIKQYWSQMYAPFYFVYYRNNDTSEPFRIRYVSNNVERLRQGVQQDGATIEKIEEIIPDDKWKLVDRESGYLLLIKDTYEEILQKYKSIGGQHLRIAPPNPKFL